jgi:GNAT superfamily N-acetyltransferase
MGSEAVTIRAATLGDMPACAAIFNRWVDETEWMPRMHDHDDVVRHYREWVFPNCRVSVAEAAGAVCAYLALARDGLVTALYADGQHRGQGVGTRLLEQAKAASPAGLSLWAFVANTGARRFYGRQGFLEVRRTAGENEEGLPDVLLHWPGSGGR